MSSLELEILRLIASSRHAVPGSYIMNSLHGAYSYQDIKSALTILTSGGWIRKTDLSAKISACSFAIEPPGSLLLAEDRERLQRESELRELEEKQKQEAEQKRMEEAASAAKERAAENAAEHKFQTKLSLKSAIFNAVADFVVGFMLGALVTNFDRILPWLLSLF